MHDPIRDNTDKTPPEGKLTFVVSKASLFDLCPRCVVLFKKLVKANKSFDGILYIYIYIFIYIYMKVILGRIFYYLFVYCEENVS